MPQESVPILERFQQILGSDYAGLLIIGLVLALGAVLVLVSLRAHRALLFLLFSGQIFFISPGVRGFMVMMRWGALAALLVLSLRGIHKLGGGQKILIVYSLYMMALAPISEAKMWSLQMSAGLLILTVAISGSLAEYISDIARAQKVMVLILFTSLVWIAVSLVAGRTAESAVGAERFVGSSGRLQGLALVGSLMAPFLLWGAVQPWKRLYRYASGIGLLVLLPMLVYAGQRVGLFGAAVGLAPLLALRVGVRRLMIAATLLLIASAGSFYLVQNVIESETRKKIEDKFIHGVTDLSGREGRWSAMLQACLSDPIFGHGAGMSEYASTQAAGGLVHNAYLSWWYDGGILALAFWVGIIIAGVLRCLRVLASGAPPEMKESVRAVLGCWLTLGSVAFFEGSLTSPTNFSAAMFVVCLALIDRFAQFARGSVVARAYEPEVVAWAPGYNQGR